MTTAALLLLMVGLGAWAARMARDTAAGRVPARLLGLGGLYLADRLLIEASYQGWGPGATQALLVARTVLGLAMGAQLAVLSLHGPRTRAAVVRVVFAAIAGLLLLAHAPGMVIAFLLMPAALSFGWVRELPTRQRLWAALGAIALLAVTVFARWRPHTEPDAHGAAADLVRLCRAIEVLAFFYVGFGARKALDAFVQDPSLGIRTIGRRLALSHVLVLLVPLLIVAGLWSFTTWIGVNSERALVAMHAVGAEAAGLRASLAQALASGGDARQALAAVAQARRAEWPNARVWRVSGDRVERVIGDAVTAEAALAGWCARLDSLPASGVVHLEDRRFLGAAARDSATGTCAVALVPITEALAGAPTRTAGAQLWMREHERETDLDSLQRVTARPDSLAGAAGDSASLARLRGLTRRVGIPDSAVKASPEVRNRPRGRLLVAGDTLELGSDAAEGDSTSGMGGATVAGVAYGREGWRRDTFYLRARVPLAETFVGLYRNARDNPYNFIPIAILVGLVLATLPFASFGLKLVRQLGRSFMQPVTALRQGTLALGESRLDYRIAVQGDDELWDAARAFNQMSEGLERARETERARDRLEQELDLARRIQQRLLPAGPPQVAGLEVAGLSLPAREVGGDYFDHIPIGDGRMLLVIADVSGKGVPAALLMSAFRASLMSQPTDRSDPADVAHRLNGFLHRSVDPGKFVTAFVGFLDVRSGRFVYANAGHNPPALMRADGRVEWLATGGLILGILPDSRFESGEATLAPGDLLALYTDGVTEAANDAGEPFGEERMTASLRSGAAKPCGQLARELVDEVRSFEGASGPADDVTLLLARLARG